MRQKQAQQSQPREYRNSWLNFELTVAPVFMLTTLGGWVGGLTHLQDVIVMSTSTCRPLHAGLWLHV